MGYNRISISTFYLFFNQTHVYFYNSNISTSVYFVVFFLVQDMVFVEGIILQQLSRLFLKQATPASDRTPQLLPPVSAADQLIPTAHASSLL